MFASDSQVHGRALFVATLGNLFRIAASREKISFTPLSIVRGTQPDNFSTKIFNCRFGFSITTLLRGAMHPTDAMSRRDEKIRDMRQLAADCWRQPDLPLSCRGRCATRKKDFMSRRTRRAPFAARPLCSAVVVLWMNQAACQCGRGQALGMDELLDRLVAKAGVDRVVAEKAVGIIFAFLLKEGPSDKVQALIDQTPGAEAAVQAASGEGGLSMGGVMGVGTRLMAAGLGMEQMQTATAELIAWAREKIGSDAVDEIVGSIPGLGQFV